MDRRRFIRLAPVSAAAATACTGKPASTPAAPDLGAFFHRLDSAMAAILEINPLEQILANVTHRKVKLRKEDTAFVQKALRAILIAGSFRDLNESEQQHPGVRARVQQHLPEMAEAFYGALDRMHALGADRARAVRETLAGDRELPMRVAEVVEKLAQSTGVPAARRLHLRAVTAQVGFRLRTQPLMAITEELDEQVRRVAEAQVVKHRELVAAAAAKDPMAAAAPAPGTAVEKTHRTLNVAGILLGLGAALTVLGVAAFGVAPLLMAFVITAGVLGLIGGLITLIIGLILEAVDWD